MKLVMPVLAAMLLLPAGAALAQMKDHDMKSMDGMKMEHAAGSMSEGEVRKVDKDAKKITIKHGPIKNLDMPAMTMVFQVKEPAMLEQVKPGDKVKFEAQKQGGAITVTRIETVK